jgi:hypothetical protein
MQIAAITRSSQGCGKPTWDRCPRGPPEESISLEAAAPFHALTRSSGRFRRSRRCLFRPLRPGCRCRSLRPRIVALFPVESVVAESCVQGIVPDAGGNNVVAVKAGDGVCTGRPAVPVVDEVRSRVTYKGVVERRADDVLQAGQGIRPPPGCRASLEADGDGPSV